MMRTLLPTLLALSVACGEDAAPAAEAPAKAPTAEPAPAAAAAPAKAEAPTKAYVCPMHPEEQSDTPGSCSKCGMDLVKADGGDAGAKPAGHGAHAEHGGH